MNNAGYTHLSYMIIRMCTDKTVKLSSLRIRTCSRGLSIAMLKNKKTLQNR